MLQPTQQPARYALNLFAGKVFSKDIERLLGTMECGWLKGLNRWWVHGKAENGKGPPAEINLEIAVCGLDGLTKLARILHKVNTSERGDLRYSTRLKLVVNIEATATFSDGWFYLNLYIVTDYRQLSAAQLHDISLTWKLAKSRVN